VRAGVDPFGALEELRSRLMGVQVVDVNELSTKARPVPFGTGVFDVRRMLAALHAHSFDGYVVFDPPPDTPAFREDLRSGLAMFRKEMASIRRASSLRQAGRGAVVSEGLRYEVLAQGDIPEPVRVARCPDGSIWFASRRGMIWAWSAEARTNTLVARIPVSTSGQRGLYGFEFDSGFLTNGFLYVYRAPILSEGNSNRVSRFTATGGRGSWRVGLETERLLLEVPSSSHGLQQGGGLLRHPKDGTLYVGTGDNLLPNETSRVYDDPMSWPQDRGDLRGKILRIATDGSIPPGNPWVATPGVRPEVFAIGFRNPVTLAWVERTGTVLVGDVGYDRTQDQEEINRLEAGANYGWPRCDGRHRETLSGGACPLPEAVGPWFSYAHDSAAAVMVGGTVDRPPAGWPERFGNGLLYSDFSRRVVRFAQIDAGRNRVTNTVPIASGLAGGVLSMTLTEEGELYMVEYGGNLSGSPDDRLSRILAADR
jgi:glucose/arabinose dehydrogenase